jgi:hypothetical protein
MLKLGIPRAKEAILPKKTVSLYSGNAETDTGVRFACIRSILTKGIQYRKYPIYVLEYSQTEKLFLS